MTKTIEIDVAQANLSEIVAGLWPYDEILLMQNRGAVARILPTTKPKPKFGSCKGMLTIVHEDDEHLQDFEEYMG